MFINYITLWYLLVNWLVKFQYMDPQHFVRLKREYRVELENFPSYALRHCKTSNIHIVHGIPWCNQSRILNMKNENSWIYFSVFFKRTKIKKQILRGGSEITFARSSSSYLRVTDRLRSFKITVDITRESLENYSSDKW